VGLKDDLVTFSVQVAPDIARRFRIRRAKMGVRGANVLREAIERFLQETEEEAKKLPE
jgi:predicted DNA-binding protein